MHRALRWFEDLPRVVVEPLLRTVAASALSLYDRPMSAAECQRALAQAMSKDLGIEYRKNLDGVYGAVDGRRGEALQRAGRLIVHHRGLCNVKPSAQNPATRVGEIFDVIGPYLVG